MSQKLHVLAAIAEHLFFEMATKMCLVGTCFTLGKLLYFSILYCTSNSDF